MIGRRAFALGGLASGLWWRSAVAQSDEPDPGDYVGRRFPAVDRRTPVAVLMVTVYSVANETQAGERASHLMTSATMPNMMTEVSMVDVHTFPLSSLSGTLATWTEVEGAAAVETLRAGMFFWRETYVWAVVATGTGTRAMSHLVSEVARDLWSRPNPARIEDLWMLLPTEADLNDAFVEMETYGRRQPVAPVGTPLPDDGDQEATAVWNLAGDDRDRGISQR